MIITRVEPGHPTVIPTELLAALGLKAGDEVVIELVGDRIIVAPADEWPDMFINNFSTFAEWSSKEDEAFDNL